MKSGSVVVGEQSSELSANRHSLRFDFCKLGTPDRNSNSSKHQSTNLANSIHQLVSNFLGDITVASHPWPSLYSS